MRYQTNTRKAGLRRTLREHVADIPEWIDVPTTVEEVFNHTDVVDVLNGRFPSLEGGQEAILAVKVANAARILLDPLVRAKHGGARPSDPWTLLVMGHTLAYLMTVDAGVAWMALRNSWGHESVNRGKEYASLSEFILFAARNWMPLFNRIVADPVFREGEG